MLGLGLPEVGRFWDHNCVTEIFSPLKSTCIFLSPASLLQYLMALIFWFHCSHFSLLILKRSAAALYILTGLYNNVLFAASFSPSDPHTSSILCHLSPLLLLCSGLYLHISRLLLPSHLASCHTELVTRYVTATELLQKHCPLLGGPRLAD